MNGYNFFCLVNDPTEGHPILQAFAHTGAGPVLAPKDLGWPTYDKARAAMFRYLSERQGVPTISAALDQFERLYAWPRQPTETLSANGPVLVGALREFMSSGKSAVLPMDNLRLSLTGLGALRRIELRSQGAGVRLAFLPRDVALFNDLLKQAGIYPQDSGWRAANSFKLEAVSRAKEEAAAEVESDLCFPELVLND